MYIWTQDNILIKKQTFCSKVFLWVTESFTEAIHLGTKHHYCVLLRDMQQLTLL